MKEVLSDVRLAVRQWSNRPAWIAVILLTLATGIGATTSVFSIVRRVLYDRCAGCIVAARLWRHVHGAVGDPSQRMSRS